MGITGLLRALADVKRPTHVSELRGARVAVDAYCFLHKGKHLAAADLLLGQPSDAYLTPILEVVSVLIAHGAEPVIVCDGGLLPAKAAVESRREKARQVAAWEAAMTISRGGVSEASKLSKAVDVTPVMAARLLRRLRPLRVEFVVAPYEADAQLAYFALSGKVDVVLSEDTDLLTFGCPRVCFGFDPRSGCGHEVRLADLPKCQGLLPYKYTPESFVDLCVLAGCDYLPSIRGVGLVTATQMLHRSGGDISRALKFARACGREVPSDYLQRFHCARRVFQSQTIFDVDARVMRSLCPSSTPEPAEQAYFGQILPDDVARGVCEGRLDPMSLKPFNFGESEPGLEATQGSARSLCSTVSADQREDVLWHGHCARGGQWSIGQSQEQGHITSADLQPIEITESERIMHQRQERGSSSTGPASQPFKTESDSSSDQKQQRSRTISAASQPFKTPRRAESHRDTPTSSCSQGAKRRRLGCRPAIMFTV